MGCCPSSPYKSDDADHSHHQQNSHSSAAARSEPSRRSKASVAPPEEETVKEVLSETPIAKINSSTNEMEEKQRGGFIIKPVQKQDHRTKKFDRKTSSVNTETGSEVSEICSLSEVSVSTAPEKRDGAGDGGEVRQRVNNRSPAKFRNRGERRDRAAAVSKSPARRSDPSPGRIRSASAREGGAVRRDWGESSGRRSGSPAATRAAETGGGRVVAGRSSSARRTGKSPGKTRKFEESDEGEVANNNNKVAGQPPTTNESLENPLVSLECFIFL